MKDHRWNVDRDLGEKRKKYWFGWPSVPRGLAARLFVNWVTQLTGQWYLDQCIHHQLIPYIRQNHQQGDYIFWPNQAENIEFVKKCDNPANVPEVGVIEDFWAYLKFLVYAKGWETKKLDQLSNRIKAVLKKLDKAFVQ
uniref:Uncharacterized protein n=1 Tax=Romanomermis culicivorax TaxID=13658 RepID=A0A915KQX1_ROMCU